MPLDIGDLVVCPLCHEPLRPFPLESDGTVNCSGCRRSYRTVRGVPRFVETDGYVGSFSFEWTRHRRTQLDDETSRESEATFRAKTGLGPDDVRGRLVLDVGCGMGRFAEVVSRWGAAVVGVDLSLAVESAYANLGGRPNVRFLQADCFKLPFAPGSFDVVYSIGVLHHTPDCAAAFRAIVPLLKPGGTLAVWLYPRMGTWERVARAYRRLTTRMPHRLLHALCYAAVPLYYLHRIPKMGAITQIILPTSMHPRARWRVLETFDWYSPAYQSLHDPEEIRGWCDAAGLTDVRLLETPVAVRARRPEM
jgi:SAM-dependent methyltransferase